MFDLLWLDDEKVINRAPSLDQLFIEDLNIDFLTEAMFDGMESKLTSSQLCNLFAVDAADVAERQNILKDLIAYPELLQLFRDLLAAILAWQDFFAIPNMDDTTSDLEAFFAMNNYAHAESYFNIINEAYDILGRHQDVCTSSQLKKLFGLIKDVHDGNDFVKITTTWAQRLSALDMPKSITLGFNLSDTFDLSHVKLLSVNKFTYLEPGAKLPKNGAPEDYVYGLTEFYRLRDDLATKGSGFSTSDMTKQTSGSTSASHANEGVRMSNFVRGALGACVGEAGVRVRDYLKQFTRWILNLKQSLTFYIGAFNFMSKVAQYDGKLCFPVIHDDKRLIAKNLYLPLLLLVLKGSRPVIPNDVSFQPHGEFALLTGANQGGKTTFLRSVGVAQFMFQLGLPIGADEAEMGVVDNIFTIFALKEEVSKSQKGKFAQEIARVSDMLNNLSTNSMVLFNEPLTGTGTAETLVISREITSTIKLLGARGIWVTHLHQIAMEIERLNDLISGSSLKSLVAKVKVNDGEDFSRPTYHIVETAPEGTSHAYDVVKRFGLKLNTLSGK